MRSAPHDLPRCAVRCCPSFCCDTITLVPVGVNDNTSICIHSTGSKQEFNKEFQQAGLGIMRRECSDCRGDQHNDKFFVRKTTPQKFDAWEYLLVTWSFNNNVFHRVRSFLFSLPQPTKSCIRTIKPSSHCTFTSCIDTAEPCFLVPCDAPTRPHTHAFNTAN